MMTSCKTRQTVFLYSVSSLNCAILLVWRSVAQFWSSGPLLCPACLRFPCPTHLIQMNGSVTDRWWSIKLSQVFWISESRCGPWGPDLRNTGGDGFHSKNLKTKAGFIHICNNNRITDSWVEFKLSRFFFLFPLLPVFFCFANKGFVATFYDFKSHSGTFQNHILQY